MPAERTVTSGVGWKEKWRRAKQSLTILASAGVRAGRAPRRSDAGASDAVRSSRLGDGGSTSITSVERRRGRSGAGSDSDGAPAADGTDCRGS